VYLVDEHDITGKMNYIPKRNDYTTLRKRYAFHHTVANLTTFNLGEKPDTIELHEQISNPAKNPNFRWEGFMFGESHMSLQLISVIARTLPLINVVLCFRYSRWPFVMSSLHRRRSR
jgi:hypothetical protein